MRKAPSTTEENKLIRKPDIVFSALVAAGLALMALTAYVPGGRQDAAADAHRAAQALAPGALSRLAARMDPAALALARRHDPLRRDADTWDRPEGWASLDLTQAPTLGAAQEPVGQTAEQINALMPFAGLPIRPMKPFVLAAAGEDRARAQQCLAQAVYYEAAREPRLGQEAVAQVVLNRVRHPAYPKSICGVVYQGAARTTGCQFTFTCDGSLARAPEPVLWRRAQDVAKRALAGYVDKSVGSATHYHAQYVAPYWAPTLVKMTQVGQHIFYRWTGPWGEPAAFTGRYAGGESMLSKAVLQSYDPRTQGGLLSPEKQGIPPERKITLAVGGEVRTYNVADATAIGGERTRIAGTLMVARRQPTADEIKQINERLAAVEKSLDAPAAAPAPAKVAVAPTASSGTQD